MQEQLDPTIVNMARAIKSVETQGQSDPYTARGKSGEYGAYQYTAPTWSADSKKYLGQDVPLEQATIEQQNRVAYNKIKELKDKGYTPIQVASIWNSGKPDAYADTSYKGTNKSGATFDVPQYASAVVNAYNQFKTGQVPNPQQTSSTVGNTVNEQPQDPSLGSELSQRAQDASKALSDASMGKINPISGLIQTAGSASGAVGDIINKGLELVPGVKQAEGWLGKQLGKTIDTPLGKTITSSVQSFQQSHPELSADIGAGFNILTAIPILKGLSVVKDIAMGSVGSVLKNTFEKAATEDLASVVAKAGKTGSSIIQNGGKDLIRENIVNPRLIIQDGFIDQNGKYATEQASKLIGEQIRHIDDTELQTALDKAGTTVANRTPLSTLKEEALADAKENLRPESPVNTMFDRIQSQYGDYVTPSQQNEIKRLLSNQVKESAFNSPEYSAAKSMRSVFQKSVEKAADTLGLGDVKAINQKMARLLKTQDILDLLNGKSVKIAKPGLLRRSIRFGAKLAGGYAGETLGNSLGHPVIGATMGAIGGNYAEKGAEGLLGQGLRNTVLKNTATSGGRALASRIARKATGLVSGSLVQKASKK